MKKVTVIDYGVGNLLSVARALEHCGAEVTISDSATVVTKSERVILPGVGAFGDGMAGLRQIGMVEPLRDFATTGRPLLGICLGMQMLMEESNEFGIHEGLGLIPGTVEAIDSTDTEGKNHKIPHIGWNRLVPPRGPDSWKNTIVADADESAETYFVHSFTAVPRNEEHRLADAYYGGRRISAAVARDNVAGCQFHPEKSGSLGLKILRRFLAA